MDVSWGLNSIEVDPVFGLAIDLGCRIIREAIEIATYIYNFIVKLGTN
jgi:hypothetical protein